MLTRQPSLADQSIPARIKHEIVLTRSLIDQTHSDFGRSVADGIYSDEIYLSRLGASTFFVKETNRRLNLCSLSSKTVRPAIRAEQQRVSSSIYYASKACPGELVSANSI